MATANLRKLGYRAPWSAVIAVAISAVFMLLTACGESEDFPSSSDAGHEIGNGDVSGDVAGDVSSDTDGEPTYPEVCAECTARGEECPTPEEFRILRQGLAGTVSEIADEVCLLDDPCALFYSVSEYTWVCEVADVGPSGNTFEVRPDGQDCWMYWAWDYASGNFEIQRDGIISTDPAAPDVKWIWHSPGSMSRYVGSTGITRLCTGEPVRGD